MYSLHTLHTTHTHTHTAASDTQTSRGKLQQWLSPKGKLAFSKWKYRRYFNLLEVKGKNIHVKCTSCPRAKEGHRATLSKQLKLDFSAPASQKLDTDWTEVFPLSTVDSDSFRALIGKIPGRAGAGSATGLWKSKFLDIFKIKKKLKKKWRSDEEVTFTGNLLLL